MLDKVKTEGYIEVMAVHLLAKVTGQKEALPDLNKICRVTPFQPHLFIIKPSYLRIYKEFSTV
jgi:hypothetical protein